MSTPKHLDHFAHTDYFDHYSSDGAHPLVTGYRSAAAADTYVATHAAPRGRVLVVRDGADSRALEVWCEPLTSGEDTDGRIHAAKV